jgi:hypothetical protein
MAGHGKNPGYIPGDEWVECQSCGLEYRKSQMRRRWDGLIVCQYDWEPRHPQDFVRARKDDMAAKGLINSPSDETFIETVCGDRTAVAGEAIAGCAIAGRDPSTDIPSATF